MIAIIINLDDYRKEKEPVSAFEKALKEVENLGKRLKQGNFSLAMKPKKEYDNITKQL